MSRQITHHKLRKLGGQEKQLWKLRIWSALIPCILSSMTTGLVLKKFLPRPSTRQMLCRALAREKYLSLNLLSKKNPRETKVAGKTLGCPLTGGTPAQLEKQPNCDYNDLRHNGGNHYSYIPN